MTVPANLIEKLRNSPTVYQEGVWVDLAVDELFEEYDKVVAELERLKEETNENKA